MFVLLFILVAVLFGLGFLHALWWVAAALLVFALVHYWEARRQGRRPPCCAPRTISCAG
ncbi:hypothetical protein GCM10010252_26070 [Streptomyces aureoverticillatus]|nr:hypothetical protein GCM10010252_26070 [Streptomyces aureoverticillatus]